MNFYACRFFAIISCSQWTTLFATPFSDRQFLFQSGDIRDQVAKSSELRRNFNVSGLPNWFGGDLKFLT